MKFLDMVDSLGRTEKIEWEDIMLSSEDYPLQYENGDDVYDMNGEFGVAHFEPGETRRFRVMTGSLWRTVVNDQWWYLIPAVFYGGQSAYHEVELMRLEPLAAGRLRHMWESKSWGDMRNYDIEMTRGPRGSHPFFTDLMPLPPQPTEWDYTIEIEVDQLADLLDNGSAKDFYRATPMRVYRYDSQTDDGREIIYGYKHKLTTSDDGIEPVVRLELFPDRIPGYRLVFLTLASLTRILSHEESIVVYPPHLKRRVPIGYFISVLKIVEKDLIEMGLSNKADDLVFKEYQ